MGHFSGSPLFLVVSGLCHFTIKSTLIFGRFSTKLGGTQNNNGPGPGRFYGETAVFPKFLKKLILILEKGTFSRRGQNMVTG